MRIGDANTFLENGSYFYHIKLAIDKPDNKQNLTLLQDWTDPIGFLEVRTDGQIYCNNGQIKPNCNAQKTQIEINSQKSEINIVVKFLIYVWLNIWIYMLTILGNFLLIYFLWIIFAKDTDYGFVTNKPEFSPPPIFPWQTQFLLNRNLDLHNTFLSYLLYLNHKKIIKITTQEPQEVLINNLPNFDKIKIEIFQELPHILCKNFNKSIQKMAELGFNQGLFESNLWHSPDLYDFVKTDEQKYYAQKPISGIKIFIFGFVTVHMTVALYFLLLIFQQTFLLGYSYFPVVIANYVIFVIGILYILVNFAKPNREGAELKAYCQRYKFYIQKAERYKLDFGNNPDSGVQYYLENVPFAAIFGYLDRFEKYMQSACQNYQSLENPQNSNQNTNLQYLQIGSNLSKSFTSTNFFVSTGGSNSSSSSSISSNSSSSGGFSGGDGSW